MKRIVTYGPRNNRLEIAEDLIPSVDEVVVAVKAAGISPGGSPYRAYLVMNGVGKYSEQENRYKISKKATGLFLKKYFGVGTAQPAEKEIMTTAPIPLNLVLR
jgi:hypothetical protein